MVRKKANLTKGASVFAPHGKRMIIESNKRLLAPFKTPISSNKSSSSLKSVLCTVSESPKKRKVSQLQRALREIKRYQENTRLLIVYLKVAFSRVVREITQNIIGKPDIRFSALSLMALQEATEMAIINLLEIANLCCAHAKRITLTPADIRLTRRAFGLSNSLNT